MARAASVPEALQVLVRHACGAAPERVHHHQSRAGAARLEQLAPGAGRWTSGSTPRPGGSERAATPRDQPRARCRGRRWCPSCRRSHRSCARATTPRARSSPGRSSCCPGSGPAYRRSCRAGWPRRRARRAPAGARWPRARAPRPRRPRRKLPSPLRPIPDQRVEDPVRRVHTVEVVRHLAAEEAGRDGVLGVPAHGHGPAVLIHRDGHGAGVRAVVRTGGMDDARAHGSMLARAGRGRKPGYPAWTCWSASG